MRVVSFPTGIAIEGEFPQPDVVETIRSYLGEDKAALSVVDPPYGKVVPNGWDHEIQDPKESAGDHIIWKKKRASGPSRSSLGSFRRDSYRVQNLSIYLLETLRYEPLWKTRPANNLWA